LVTGPEPDIDSTAISLAVSSQKKYAFEELVAELTSAFLCAHLGLQAELRHAGYIEHYLEVLKDDDRAFFRAAAKAQQAADFLRSFSDGGQDAV
jgi:antirestriction protein ArdC